MTTAERVARIRAITAVLIVDNEDLYHKSLIFKSEIDNIAMDIEARVERLAGVAKAFGRLTDELFEKTKKMGAPPTTK